MVRSFNSLSEKEILAVAINVEKSNAERFESLAEFYIDYDKEIFDFFSEMKEEELKHLRIVETSWKEKFGNEQMPNIDETEIREVIEAVDVEHGEHMLFDDIKLEDAFRMANNSEVSARKFYQQAADSVGEGNLRKVLLELIEFENSHIEKLQTIKNKKLINRNE